MKKTVLILGALIAFSLTAMADEGMWLPSLISQRIVPPELVSLNDSAVGGMCSVAVKCLEITQNTDCEGISRRVD